MINLKILAIIMNEGYDKKVKLLLNRYGVKYKLITSASGTASPSMLDFFGLIETKKNLYLAILPDYLIDKVITRIYNTFHLKELGAGIVFTLPISSANKFLVDTYSKNNLEREDNVKDSNKKYHLILTIVSDGYLESVIKAFKKAGVSGGTVIKARELGNIVSKKILGFNIEGEKHIVLNLVLDEEKKKTMEAITKAVGIKTEAKGICLALPVEDVLGIE